MMLKMVQKLNISFLILLLVASTFLTSCYKDTSLPKPIPTYETEKRAFISYYSSMASQLYLGCYNSSLKFEKKVETFIANPSEDGFSEIKNIYANDLRYYYDHTDIFRFYGGPIDGENGPEGLLNSWPMDESYIDYVVGNQNSGIINNVLKYPKITEDTLELINENGGETFISVGFHAVEFLLWGQDLSSTGPGNRSYLDYTEGINSTAKNGKRRGQYLLACSKLLSKHLKFLSDEWKSNASNYRSKFENMPLDSSLKLSLTGLGRFIKGELYGERMAVAYDTRAQEDEHSCFSDQTDKDLKWGQEGVYWLYFGESIDKSRTSIASGTGLNVLFSKVYGYSSDPSNAIFVEANTATNAIQPPFDQEILKADGRIRIKTAIDAGKKQADYLVQLADKLGIKLAL